MRVLGVDLGRRRIGIAIGESTAKICSPRKVMSASGSLGKDAQNIDATARAEKVERIVVGVPIRHDEAIGDHERACLRLAEHLEILGWEVEKVDESLTSVEASEALASTGIKAAARRKVIHGEAACRILQRYFGGYA